jgi:hypothetical protein
MIERRVIQFIHETGMRGVRPERERERERERGLRRR